MSLELIGKIAAALAGKRGLEQRAYLVGDRTPHVRVEFAAPGGDVTCWVELDGSVLAVADHDRDAFDQFVRRELAVVLEGRHGGEPGGSG